MLCFSLTEELKFSVTFESEAEPQLFLACSYFLGKFEPRCSYEIVVMKISVYMKALVQIHGLSETSV